MSNGSNDHGCPEFRVCTWEEVNFTRKRADMVIDNSGSPFKCYNSGTIFRSIQNSTHRAVWVYTERDCVVSDPTAGYPELNPGESNGDVFARSFAIADIIH